MVPNDAPLRMARRHALPRVLRGGARMVMMLCGVRLVAVTVDQMVHDAQRAIDAARLAAYTGDGPARDRLYAKLDALLRAALALDPDMEDATWMDTEEELHGIAVAIRFFGATLP